MAPPSVLLKRSLIFIHRWMGVLLSVIFLLWFTSGVVMMYWTFPDINAKDRLQRAPILNPSQIKISPEEAYAKLALDRSPTSVQLASFDGRPVYRFDRGRGRTGDSYAMVYADDGSTQVEVNAAMIDRAASAWAGKPLSEAKKEPLEEVDQWTVGSNLRTLRPLYKYSFLDGQQVYISGRSAEVVQYTTSESRFWAYLGAIPHWLYFTPLRKHQPEWFQFVVWSSGIGTVAALLGVVIAVWMLSPSKRYRHAGAPTSIPYRGWKRWHTIFGLFFGLVTLTWAFSGLLSMGPFDRIERLTGTTRENGKGNDQAEGGRDRVINIVDALRGNGRFELSAYAAKPLSVAIASLGGDFQVRELELSVFAGEPLYIATGAQGRTRIIPMVGEPQTELDRGQVINLVKEAAGLELSDIRVIEEYDAYYLDRQGEKPLPVIYVRLGDDGNTRYYIDPKTGRTAGSYSSRNWVNRWLYHGLHSFDFPWLYKHRPLWDIVVITLMLGGTTLCVTSLVLTYRVLQRKLAAAMHVPTQQISEDLAKS